jgi:hypothetical protein
MRIEDLDLFHKGYFRPIDNNFITEGHEVLQRVKKVQEKYNKNDTDTFINELRDSIAGYLLGFDLVNVEKHGFDCKSSKTGNLLEVKSASFDARSWQSTFNDTTLEKAQAFKNEKVYLAQAVWKGASELLFLAYGQNERIGEFLEDKVKWFKSGHTVRSTQSIGLSDLIFKYDFRILTINKTKEEIKDLLIYKNRTFMNLRDNQILTRAEFKDISL